MLTLQQQELEQPLLTLLLLISTIHFYASTDSPVANTVATYDATVYNGGYYIVTVEDLTNGYSQVSELMVANNEEFNNITEFGEIITMVTSGEFGVRRTADTVQVTFEPNADADMEVRVFQNAMRLVDPLNGVTTIDLNNGTVQTGASEYFEPKMTLSVPLS